MPVVNRGSAKKDDLVTPGPDVLSEWEREDPVSGQKMSQLWLEGDAAKAEAEGWTRVSKETEQDKVDESVKEFSETEKEHQDKVREHQKEEAEKEAAARKEAREKARDSK